MPVMLAALALPGIQVAASSPAPADDRPVRILLVGDSVTQGSAGDFTWRYRLWRHFQAAGVDVDFVGPRTDLYDNVLLQFGSTDYADTDPAFDRDHAGRWGMTLDVQDVPIGTLVADYRPDVVVEMLGVNDLTFGGRTPEVVTERVRTFVGDARAEDPTVDLVLAEATQTWREGVPEFNSRLDVLADELATDTSSVVSADTDDDANPDGGYDEYADTWDTAHPNARGEVKIAAAVADALSTMGIGPAATRPLPTVPLGPRSAPVLAVTPGDRAATLSWAGPPGATGVYVWVRDVTKGEPWQRLPWQVTDSPWTDLLLTNGHRYDFRLQPLKGDEEAAGDIRSNVATVVPQPSPPDRVAKPALTPRMQGLAVRWPTAARATSYRVTWWPTGNTAAKRARATTGTSATITALAAGRSYAVQVRARNGGGWGPVSSAATAQPLGPRPDAPRELALQRTSRHRVLATWRSSTHATRYQVQVRLRSETTWATAGWTTRRTFTTRSLTARRTYVFRVRAWHQYVPGGRSRTATITIR